jgi:formylmethanofuran dehydrogenase subunit B
MGSDNKNLVDAIKVSVRQLQKGIDTHCSLVASMLKETVDERNINPIFDLIPKKSRELKLREAIHEAIEVLEESRKAFKSKNLGTLRKKLIQVLIETN